MCFYSSRPTLACIPHLAMKVSPLCPEFLARPSIDKDPAIEPCRESCGWLLSSPLTTIFSKVHLTNPLRPQDSDTGPKMSGNNLDHPTVACQVSFNEIPTRLSLLSNSSDESDFWMTDNLLADYEDDTFLGNSHSSYSSSNTQLEDEEKIWCLYDDLKDIASPASSQEASPGDNHDVVNQGVALTNSTSIEIAKKVHLKRASATRSSRRNKRPKTPVSPTAYSAFPACTPTPDAPSQEYHMRYHSWPLPSEAPTEHRDKPQGRTRANTTSAVPTIRKVSRPSKLSMDTTHDIHTSTSQISMPACTDVTPPSPLLMSSPDRDLMAMMADISAFSDDEDDEEPGDKSTIVLAVKSVLSLGMFGAGSENERFSVQQVRMKSQKRTRSGALRAWFSGKNKGATL